MEQGRDKELVQCARIVYDDRVEIIQKPKREGTNMFIKRLARFGKAFNNCSENKKRFCNISVYGDGFHAKNVFVLV